jgi:hypothetical protein
MIAAAKSIQRIAKLCSFFCYDWETGEVDF